MATLASRLPRWGKPRVACLAGTAILVCCGAVRSLRAELTWAQKTIELSPDAKAAVLEARFRFTNTGDKPVDLRQVQTGCGCTTVTIEQRHYEPGQTGEIVARFTAGDRRGLQKNLIMVSTSDRPVPTFLTLIAHLPEVVRIEPGFVSWQQGEPAAAKVISLARGDNAAGLGALSVESSIPAMRTELQTVSEGNRYQP
jgi:hypothetical protein